MRLLVISAAFTVLVGLGVAFRARRLLAPLTAVTERAQAVARGDLTARAVVASNDEIGELAATFESMVAAIARANAELLSSERLAAIGKMAAQVTHEVRNPLSSLALNVELLEEELSGKGGEALALITSRPAEVIGMGGRFGKLAAGQAGDVVLWSGDPLEVASAAERVWIDGVEQPLETRQTKLRDRYRSLEREVLPEAYRK